MKTDNLRTFLVVFAKDGEHKIIPGLLSAKSNDMAKFVGAQCIQDIYDIQLPLDQIKEGLKAFNVGKIKSIDEALEALGKDAAKHSRTKQTQRGRKIGERMPQHGKKTVLRPATAKG